MQILDTNCEFADAYVGEIEKADNSGFDKAVMLVVNTRDGMRDEPIMMEIKEAEALRDALIEVLKEGL